MSASIDLASQETPYVGMILKLGIIEACKAYKQDVSIGEWEPREMIEYGLNAMKQLKDAGYGYINPPDVDKILGFKFEPRFK